MNLLRRRAVWLLALAFALRVAAGAWWEARLPEGARFGFGDSDGYWRLGQALAQGKPYQYGSDRVFRAPGYPLILSALFRLTGGETPTFTARLWTAAFSSLLVVGVYWLALTLFDARAALLAALGAAVYPLLAAMGMLLLSEGPFCAVVPFQLACWVRGWQTADARRAAAWLLAAGALAGAAALIRPDWLLFTPFAIGLAVLFSPDRKRHLMAGGWLLLGLCLVMTPWWTRNYRVTGHFVPTTLQVGASLYDGLGPQATGASQMDFVPILADKLRRQEAGKNLPPEGFEYRFDQYLRRLSIHWAKAHPGEALRLAGVKLARMWNIWPNEARFQSPLVRAGMTVTYLPLMVLGLWGAWAFRRRGWPYLLCLVPAAYLTLLHLVFVSSIRYRQPALPSLIVLAAGLVAEKWHFGMTNDERRRSSNASFVIFPFRSARKLTDHSRRR